MKIFKSTLGNQAYSFLKLDNTFLCNLVRNQMSTMYNINRGI